MMNKVQFAIKKEHPASWIVRETGDVYPARLYPTLETIAKSIVEEGVTNVKWENKSSSKNDAAFVLFCAAILNQPTGEWKVNRIDLVRDEADTIFPSHLFPGSSLISNCSLVIQGTIFLGPFWRPSISSSTCLGTMIRPNGKHVAYLRPDISTVHPSSYDYSSFVDSFTGKTNFILQVGLETNPLLPLLLLCAFFEANRKNTRLGLNAGNVSAREYAFIQHAIRRRQLEALQIPDTALEVIRSLSGIETLHVSTRKGLLTSLPGLVTRSHPINVKHLCLSTSHNLMNTFLYAMAPRSLPALHATYKVVRIATGPDPSPPSIGTLVKLTELFRSFHRLHLIEFSGWTVTDPCSEMFRRFCKSLRRHGPQTEQWVYGKVASYLRELYQRRNTPDRDAHPFHVRGIRWDGDVRIVEEDIGEMVWSCMRPTILTAGTRDASVFIQELERILARLRHWFSVRSVYPLTLNAECACFEAYQTYRGEYQLNELKNKKTPLTQEEKEWLALHEGKNYLKDSVWWKHVIPFYVGTDMDGLAPYTSSFLT